MKNITPAYLKKLIASIVEDILDDPYGEILVNPFDEEYRRKISQRFPMITYQGDFEEIEDFLRSFDSVTDMTLSHEQKEYFFECSFACVPTLEFKVKFDEPEQYYHLETLLQLWRETLELDEDLLYKHKGLVI